MWTWMVEISAFLRQIVLPIWNMSTRWNLIRFYFDLIFQTALGKPQAFMSEEALSEKNENTASSKIMDKTTKGVSAYPARFKPRSELKSRAEDGKS